MAGGQERKAVSAGVWGMRSLSSGYLCPASSQWDGVRVPGQRLRGDWVLRPALRAALQELRGPALTREGDEKAGPGWERGQTVECLGLHFPAPPPGFRNDISRLQLLTLGSTHSA